MKYRAICPVCYTCHLTPPVGKRAAELVAASHMRIYGHDTTVQPVK